MHVPSSILLEENCQESLKRCIMLPRLHNSIYTLHEKMTNELGKFEEVQGCVIVLSLVQKAVQILLLDTLCPFNVSRQTLY